MKKDLNNFINNLKLSKTKLSLETNKENSKKLKQELIEKIEIFENKIENVINNVVIDILEGPGEINFEKPRIEIINNEENNSNENKKDNWKFNNINKLVNNVIKNKNFKIKKNIKLIQKKKFNNKKIIKNRLAKPKIILPKEIRVNPFAYIPVISKDQIQLGALNLLQIGVIPKDIDIQALLNLNKPILNHKKLILNKYNNLDENSNNINLKDLNFMNYNNISKKHIEIPNHKKNKIKLAKNVTKKFENENLIKSNQKKFNLKEYIIKIIEPQLIYKDKKIIINDDIIKYLYTKETNLGAFNSLISYLEFILFNIYHEKLIELNLNEICNFSLLGEFPNIKNITKFIKQKYNIKTIKELDFYINYDLDLKNIIYIQSKIRQYFSKKLTNFKKKIIKFAHKIQTKFQNLVLKQKFKMIIFKNKIKMIDDLLNINKNFIENYNRDDEIIEIHINSYYLGRFKDNLHYKYNHFENLGVYRIFRTFKNKKIIYIFNKEIYENNLENIFKIFEINEKTEKINNLYLLFPENRDVFKKNKLCLSNLIYYSPELLKNIKDIIKNKKAIIVSNSKPNFYDYNIANYLKLPFFPINFNLPSLDILFKELNITNILNIKKVLPEIDNFYKELANIIFEYNYKFLKIQIICEENYDFIGILPINNIPFINLYKKKYKNNKNTVEKDNIIEQFINIWEKNFIENIRLSKFYDINNKLFLSSLNKNGCYISNYENKLQIYEAYCYVDFQKMPQIKIVYEKIIFNKINEIGYFIYKQWNHSLLKSINLVLNKLLNYEIYGEITLEFSHDNTKKNVFILRDIRIGKTIFQSFFDLIENLNKKINSEILIIPYINEFLLNLKNEKDINKRLKLEQLNYDYYKNQGVLLWFNKEFNWINSCSLIISGKINIKKSFNKIIETLQIYQTNKEDNNNYLLIVKKVVNKFLLRFYK